MGTPSTTYLSCHFQKFGVLSMYPNLGVLEMKNKKNYLKISFKRQNWKTPFKSPVKKWLSYYMRYKKTMLSSGSKTFSSFGPTFLHFGPTFPSLDTLFNSFQVLGQPPLLTAFTLY